jgi:hypothetical protein
VKAAARVPALDERATAVRAGRAGLAALAKQWSHPVIPRYEVLRPSFREVIPEDALYDKAFDLFEYLYALVHADLSLKLGGDVWGPLGRFGWKDLRDGAKHIFAVVQRAIDSLGENWPPLKVGLFDGSLERLQTIKGKFDQRIAGLRWGW